jgi:hypothetical protein
LRPTGRGAHPAIHNSRITIHRQFFVCRADAEYF